MKTSLRRCAALLILTFSASAFANGGDSLDQVVVTATRTPEVEADVLASVTVLDRTRIEARQASSLPELLRGIAGVEIANNGGLGKVSSIFMRGMESGHVLVLVDGVPLSSATVGTTAIQYLPVEEIDHIEIVRGPRSSLYGSDALAGVIQIFTRRGSGPFEPDVSLSAGSHGLAQVSAGGGGATGRLSYSASGSYQTTNGYDSCVGAPYISAASPGGGCYTVVPYDDRYRNASYAARLAYRPSDDSELDAHILRAQGMSDFHSDYQNREEFVQQSAGVDGHFSPAAGLRLTMRLGQARDNALDEAVGLALNPQYPVGPSTYRTTRNTGTAQADWKIGAHDTLTAGGDYLRDQIDSDTQYPVRSRRNTALFGQYDGEHGAEHVVVSARRDQNQQFGAKTTGGAAWGYRFANAVRFSASFGTAFKAPSFNELYYPYYGNPGLKPESSRTAEIGLDHGDAGDRWSLHAYETQIADLIATNANFTADNIERARIRGLEAEVAGGMRQWSWDVTADWLDPRNESNDPNRGKLLQRRARASGRARLARQFTGLRVAAQVNVSGPAWDDLPNTQRLGGYATLDLLAAWQLRRGLYLEGKLANLAGKRYQTALYYPQDGRNYLLTLSYRPRPSH